MSSIHTSTKIPFASGRRNYTRSHYAYVRVRVPCVMPVAVSTGVMLAGVTNAAQKQKLAIAIKIVLTAQSLGA